MRLKRTFKQAAVLLALDCHMHRQSLMDRSSSLLSRAPCGQLHGNEDDGGAPTVRAVNKLILASVVVGPGGVVHSQQLDLAIIGMQYTYVMVRTGKPGGRRPPRKMLAPRARTTTTTRGMEAVNARSADGRTRLHEKTLQ